MAVPIRTISITLPAQTPPPGAPFSLGPPDSFTTIGELCSDMKRLNATVEPAEPLTREQVLEKLEQLRAIQTVLERYRPYQWEVVRMSLVSPPVATGEMSPCSASTTFLNVLPPELQCIRDVCSSDLMRRKLELLEELEGHHGEGGARVTVEELLLGGGESQENETSSDAVDADEIDLDVAEQLHEDF